MKQYKVLTQKDKWYSGKFDPALLEKALNSYAQQGWKVVTSCTAAMPGILTGTRDEMIIILERESDSISSSAQQTVSRQAVIPAASNPNDDSSVYRL